MIVIKKFKSITTSYPIIISKNFLSKELCYKISEEIRIHNQFDDTVMGGRNRINKGSNNFSSFIKKSKNCNKFYRQINNYKFYGFLKNIFEKSKVNKKWIIPKVNKFSKRNFGLQKGKSLVKHKSKKNIVNLDIDFSLSRPGYFREPHRDRETRIINFLIYLNTIPKRFGGALEIYSIKKNLKKNSFEKMRFPKKNKLKLTKKFSPKIGDSIFFLSSPDSYHGVSRFKPTNKSERVFIYGSFSLNKSVKWLEKNNNN